MNSTNNYINEKIINDIASKNDLNIVDLYQSNDVRTIRNNEKWINIIFKSGKD